MKGIRYYWFVLHWLWANRNWSPSRQKFKAMDKDWRKHEIALGRAV